MALLPGLQEKQEQERRGRSGSELLPHWGVAMKLNISQVFSSYFDLLPSLCSFASDVALYIYFLRRHFVLHRAKHLLGAERKHSKLNYSRKIYRGFLLVTCVHVCIMYVCIQIYILRGCLALVKDATCLIVINSMSICFHFCRLSLHKFEILHSFLDDATHLFTVVHWATGSM